MSERGKYQTLVLDLLRNVFGHTRGVAITYINDHHDGSFQSAEKHALAKMNEYRRELGGLRSRVGYCMDERGELQRRCERLEAENVSLRDKARTLYRAAEQLAYAAGGTVACHAQPFPPEIEELNGACSHLRDVLWREDSIRPLLESPEASR